jgi:hypothetical protein
MKSLEDTSDSEQDKNLPKRNNIYPKQKDQGYRSKSLQQVSSDSTYQQAHQ